LGFSSSSFASFMGSSICRAAATPAPACGARMTGFAATRLGRGGSARGAGIGAGSGIAAASGAAAAGA